jgi:hypothetical protein
MIGDLNFLPVNWIDGMKISRKHFEQSEKYLHERLGDLAAQQLTDFNFGLLATENALVLNVYCDSNQQISMELKSCKALTPNGSRIQILAQDNLKASSNFKELAKKFNLQTSLSQSLSIIVSTDVLKRVATGEPLLDENPPRHPDTKSEILLDIIPSEYVNSAQLSNSIVIGKVEYLNGDLIYQKEFIPPCVAVNSYPALTDWFNKFRVDGENWEQFCVKIIQKVNSKTQSQQPNALAISILKLSERMLAHLSQQKIMYRWILGKLSPIFLCHFLLGNIQFILTTLQCYAEKDKEEMLNYFAEWTDVPAGALENATSKVLQLEYNHSDIAGVLKEINLVYQQYLQIFQKLAQLDFIGKKKGQNIFVIEQEVKDARQPNPQEKPNNRWSPLT